MSEPTSSSPFINSANKEMYGKIPLQSWVGKVVSYEEQKEQLDEGWGWRYKVRILGDNSDVDQVEGGELSYALCILPTTAGSGAAFKLRSVRISQGDMVYGVFGGDGPRIILGVFPRTTKSATSAGKFGTLSGFYGSLKENKTLSGEFNEQIGPKTPPTGPVGPKNYSKAEKKEPSDKAKELGVIAGGDENVNVEEKLTPKKIFLSLKDYAQNLLKGKNAVNSKENLDRITDEVIEKEDRTQEDIETAKTAIKVSKEQNLIEETVAKEKENKINKLEVVKKETQNNRVFNIFSKRYPYVDTSGLKSYADYIAEGVEITEIGPNDFTFKYPNGRRVISSSTGRSNASTVEERFDALVFTKQKDKQDEIIREQKREEERKKREEKQRLRDIEWAKRFPNLYNPDGTRK